MPYNYRSSHFLFSPLFALLNLTQPDNMGYRDPALLAIFSLCVASTQGAIFLPTLFQVCHFKIIFVLNDEGQLHIQVNKPYLLTFFTVRYGFAK